MCLTRTVKIKFREKFLVLRNKELWREKVYCKGINGSEQREKERRNTWNFGLLEIMRERTKESDKNFDEKQNNSNLFSTF
jgi:hypothetical protein